MADNSRLLIDAAAARRMATIKRAREAIARLDRAGQPVSFRTVALAAGVSRSWLYRDKCQRRCRIQRSRTTGRSGPLLCATRNPGLAAPTRRCC